MQRFQFYIPDGAQPPGPEEIAVAIHAEGGTLDGCGGYRPGAWRDAATGSRIVLDVGDPPLEEDTMHPSRQYAGWRPVPLAVQVPLTGPHWQAVECFAWIERLVARLPGVLALDTEDIQETPESEPGPFAWKRPRTLATWEKLHLVQVETRTDLAVMPRGDSLRLWRYRRERLSAAVRLPELPWPETPVLRDAATGAALAACIWHDPTRPVALPPVALVVVPQGGSAVAIPRSALPEGADLGIATRLDPLPHLPAGLPATRFRAIDDADWVD